MLQFEKLLSRLDGFTLETLVGKPTVALLRVLDEEGARPSDLRKLLLRMKNPSEFFLDPLIWSEVVNVLKDEEGKREAATLCEILGREPELGDFWSALKSVKLTRGSRLHKLVCDFFSVDCVVPDSAPMQPASQTHAPSYALFSHQRRAAERAIRALGTGGRRVVLHMPTGAGKTRTAMHVIANHLLRHEPGKVIWLAYSEELCEQAASEFEKAWSHLGNREVTVDRFWGGYKADPLASSDGLIVAGLDRVFSRAKASTPFIAGLADQVSLVVIDEAHQSTAPTYALVLDLLQSKHPDTAMLGLTATPGRSWDDLEENQKLANFWGNTKVALQVDGYDSPVSYLFEEGYLARPTYQRLGIRSGVSLTDKDLGQIERQLDIPDGILKRLGADEQRNLLVLSQVEKLASKHARILVFAASVEGAETLARVLQMHGRVDANVVTGKTPTTARKAVVDWYKTEDGDRARVLCNFGVLTEGFDAPRTSCVVIARPTKSIVLWSQMVGRGTRGVRAGGNSQAEIVTVVDTTLPGFDSLVSSFEHWGDEDGWKTNIQ